ELAQAVQGKVRHKLANGRPLSVLRRYLFIDQSIECGDPGLIAVGRGLARFTERTGSKVVEVFLGFAIASAVALVVGHQGVGREQALQSPADEAQAQKQSLRELP